MKKINKVILSSVLTLGMLGAASVALVSGHNQVANVKATDGVEFLTVADQDMSTARTYTSPQGGTVKSEFSSSKVTLTFNNFQWFGACSLNSYYSYKFYSTCAYRGSLPLEVVVNGSSKLMFDRTEWDPWASATGSEAFYVYNNNKGTTFTGNGSIEFHASDGETQTNMKTTKGFNTENTKTLTINGPKVTFVAGAPSGASVDTESDSSIGLKISYSGTVKLLAGELRVETNRSPCASYGVKIETGTLDIQGGTFICRHYTSQAKVSTGVYLKYEGGSLFNVSDKATFVDIDGIDYSPSYIKAVDGQGQFITKLPGKWISHTGPTKAITASDSKQAYPTDSCVKSLQLKDKIVASATGYSGAYDGQGHKINVSVTKPTSGYTIEYSKDNTNWSTTNPAITAEGETIVYWRVSVPNLDTVSGSAKITLTKSLPEYTAPIANNLAYTGSDQELVSGGTITGGTFEYSLTKDGTYTSSISKGKLPGSYSVYYNVKGDAYHKSLLQQGPIAVTIGKAALQNVSVSANSSVYDGTEQTPTLVEQGSTVDGSAITYTYSKSQSGTYGPISELKFKDAGSHRIFYKANAEYHIEAVGSFTFDIAAKEMPEGGTITVNYPTEPVDYTGSRIPFDIDTTSLTTPTGDEVTYVYSLSESGTYVPLDQFNVIDAGVHTVYWKVIANGYTSYGSSFEVTINKVEAEVKTAPTAKELKYTAKAQELVNAGSSDDGRIKYRLGEEDDFSYSIPKATNVDEYDVYWILEPDANHTCEMEPVKITVKINENDKALLTSSIDTANKMYDIIAANHEESAATLKSIIDAAKVILENPNVTEAQINKAISDLLSVEVNLAKQLIDEIGEVKYPSSKTDIKEARAIYDLLPEEEQAKVDNIEVLEEAEKTYSKLDAEAHKGLPGWAIALIVLGSILLVLCGIYFLMMFAFNKWVVYKGEVRRAFKLMESGSAVRMVVFPLHLVSILDTCVFNTKEEASKFIGK